MNESQPVHFSAKLRSRLEQLNLRRANGDEEGIRRDKRVGEAIKKAREAKSLSMQKVTDEIGIEGFGQDELIFLEQGLLPWLDLPAMVGPRLINILPDLPSSPAIGELVIRDIERFPGLYQENQ